MGIPARDIVPGAEADGSLQEASQNRHRLNRRKIEWGGPTRDL